MRFIITAFLGFLLFTSCSKILEEKPRSIASEVFYNTPAEIEAGLNSIYNPLRAGSSLGGLYTVQVECYGDYMYGRGSHAPLNEYAGLDNTNISRVAGMWFQFYQSIRNANIIIQNLGKGKLSTEIAGKYLGEARFLRALNYFYLVRNWAGVPLRNEGNIDSIDIKRSSPSEVYDFIVNDLKFAEENLPETPRLLGVPSKWAAKTLLADVYLNLKNYPTARDKFREVIQSNKFSLVGVANANDFEKIYGPDVVTTSEEIFYLKFSRLGDNQGFGYVMFALSPGSGFYPPGGYYTFYSDSVKNPVIRDWDKNDLRYKFNWYYYSFGAGTSTILNKKYKDPQAVNPSNAGNDYPIYRYAEVLLYYAEAESRVNGGPNADAVEKLNMVRRRAYGINPSTPNANDYKLSDFSNAQSFLDAVIKERCYETVSEGKRWLDLKRLGIVKEVILAAKGKTVADKHLLWPIPATEYNYNKGIDPVKDQNPGY